MNARIYRKSQLNMRAQDTRERVERVVEDVAAKKSAVAEAEALLMHLREDLVAAEQLLEELRDEQDTAESTLEAA